MDIIVYIAVILAIIVRLVIMRGTFVLPTIYKRGNEMTFNLGSISTIIILNSNCYPCKTFLENVV